MSSDPIDDLMQDIARLEISGRYDDAMARLRPWLDVPRPRPRIVGVYARLCVHYGEEEKALPLLEDALGNPGLPLQLQSGLHYLSGNLYDRLKEYDKAFLHYRAANDAQPVQLDVQGYEASLKAQRQFFTRSTMDRLARADIEGPLPVFIVGMPRSGTTLTEQIMDRHSRIHGAGELVAVNEMVMSLQRWFSLKSPYPACLAGIGRGKLNRLARFYLDMATKDSSGAGCVTDKMPGNCGHLGLIELILPSARVVHCRRHPLDTCLSCYFQNFGNMHLYSRRLDYTARMYRIYLSMVAMWDGVISLPVHELRYEDMVRDQEGTSRRLIAFCGFDWEEQCLRFNESGRDVNTSSYNQVRTPMYTSSVQRWRNYEKHIGPLLGELEDIVDAYVANERRE